MNRKRFIVQVIVGIFLFIGISVILEGEYTQDVWIEKTKTALVFGLVYGMFLWAKEKFKK